MAASRSSDATECSCGQPQGSVQNCLCKAASAPGKCGWGAATLVPQHCPTSSAGSVKTVCASREHKQFLHACSEGDLSHVMSVLQDRRLSVELLAHKQHAGFSAAAAAGQPMIVVAMLLQLGPRAVPRELQVKCLPICMFAAQWIGARGGRVADRGRRCGAEHWIPELCNAAFGHSHLRRPEGAARAVWWRGRWRRRPSSTPTGDPDGVCSAGSAPAQVA